MPECSVPQYSAQKMWKRPVFVAWNHIVLVAVRQHVGLHAEGREEEAVNHILRGHA